jgi:dTDP-4-dehydrorhamnose reductase
MEAPVQHGCNQYLGVAHTAHLENEISIALLYISTAAVFDADGKPMTIGMPQPARPTA